MQVLSLLELPSQQRKTYDTLTSYTHTLVMSAKCSDGEIKEDTRTEISGWHGRWF